MTPEPESPYCPKCEGPGWLDDHDDYHSTRCGAVCAHYTYTCPECKGTGLK